MEKISLNTLNMIYYRVSLVRVT